MLTVGLLSTAATSGRCCIWLTGFLPSLRHSGRAPQGYVSRCIPPLACHPNRSGRSGAGTAAAARTCRTCPSQNRHATSNACRSTCNTCNLCRIQPQVARHQYNFTEVATQQREDLCRLGQGRVHEPAGPNGSNHTSTYLARPLPLPNAHVSTECTLCTCKHRPSAPSIS